MFAWLNLFGKAPEETKWDPKTVSMECQQPTSPDAPSTKRDSHKAVRTLLKHSDIIAIFLVLTCDYYTGRRRAHRYATTWRR